MLYQMSVGRAGRPASTWSCLLASVVWRQAPLLRTLKESVMLIGMCRPHPSYKVLDQGSTCSLSPARGVLNDPA